MLLARVYNPTLSLFSFLKRQAATEQKRTCFHAQELLAVLKNFSLNSSAGFKLGYSVLGKSHHPMDISQTRNIEAEMAARTSERLCWTHCVCR